MSAQIARETARRILQQATKTTTAKTTRQPGSKPSLGSALQGEGEFKAFNLDPLVLGEAVFRWQLRNVPESRPKVTGQKPKQEPTSLFEAWEFPDRTPKHRRTPSQPYRGRATTSQPSRHSDLPRRRPPYVPGVAVPRTGTPQIPGRDPKPPRYPPFYIPEWPERTIDIPDSDIPTPTDPSPPYKPDKEKRETDVYTCEAAEEAMRNLGVEGEVCPRVSQQISIRALLRGL